MFTAYGTAWREAAHRERGIGRMSACSSTSSAASNGAIPRGRQIHLGAQDARRLWQPVHLERSAAEGHGQRTEDHLPNGCDVCARGTIVLRKDKEKMEDDKQGMQ